MRQLMVFPYLLASYLALLPSLAFAAVLCDRSAKIPDAQASDAILDTEALLDLSLEELFEIEITSAQKTPQNLSEVPAAIFVITHDDIKRSGVTHIPDLLRMVPGMQVARLNEQSWAISSRGFNNYYANKQLVLIDGRTIYSPLFSGTFWDRLGVNLDDIERIEVIRGTGGTIWGANAVNGVINIITKKARDTQCGTVSAMASEQTPYRLAFRYGGHSGQKHYWRFAANRFKQDTFERGTGQSDADRISASFRADLALSSWDELRISGGAYSGERDIQSLNPSLPSFEDYQGYHLDAAWRHHMGKQSDISLQTYFDQNEIDNSLNAFEVLTFDVDFQHRFAWLNETQQLTWGMGYRYIEDTLTSFDPTTEFLPSALSTHLLSAFIQNETPLSAQLWLTLGAKFERNDVSGNEYQPSLRLLWQPNNNTAVWGAVSRAIRTLSRFERDIRLERTLLANNPFAPLPGVLIGESSTNDDSEELLAYELGMRQQTTARFSWDAALFYNRYTQLRVATQSAFVDLEAGRGVIYSSSLPTGDVDTYGVELAANWKVVDNVLLSPAYTFFDTDIRRGVDSQAAADEISRLNAQQQFSLRAEIDLPQKTELNLWLRYVDDLLNPDYGQIAAYWSADAHFAWHYRDNLTVSLIGQNLLDSHHMEFGPTPINALASEVERNIALRIRWAF